MEKNFTFYVKISEIYFFMYFFIQALAGILGVAGLLVPQIKDLGKSN